MIDDDTDARELMASLISVRGFNVMTASDGEMGIEKFRSARIDIVIVDVSLPGMNGYQVIDTIRPLVKDGTKIFLWSALAVVRRIDGVGILGKPFDIDELWEKIGHDGTVHPSTTDDKGRDGLQAK